MHITRELQRLQERVNKISLAQSPPDLQVIVTGTKEEAPQDLSAWTLVVQIEEKL